MDTAEGLKWCRSVAACIFINTTIAAISINQVVLSDLLFTA